MADSVSDIRRRTRAIIEENERKHQAEIRALETDYRRKTEALRAESEKQQAKYRREIAELDRKIQAALEAGRLDIAEQTRKLAAEQRRKLNEIEIQSQKAIEQCSRELKAEIDRRYRIVEEEIRKLYEAISSQDEKERLCAEHALRKAEEAFRQALASESVQEFNKDMLETLQEMYTRLDVPCKQEIWSALSSSALALELACVCAVIEADEKLEAWTLRNRKLLQRVQAMQTILGSTREESWHFHHWLLDYTCALHPWNDAAFAVIGEHLDQMNAMLKARKPRCTMGAMADMFLEVSQEEALLDTAMDCAQRHVGSFLSLAQLMAGLTEEIPMADTYWELAEEAQLEPVTNVGTIAFRLTGGPIGHLNIRVEEQRALGGSLMLTMLYDGTRHPVRREQELRAICAWLATALSDERYGGVVLGNPSPFKVGDVVGLKVPVGDIRVQQGVWTGTVPAEPATPPAAPSARINPTGSMGESPVS